MLSPLKSAFALLLVLGLSLATFSISDYLYDDETTDSVSYSDFTYLGDSYRIVSMAGTDVFLLRNNEVVENQTDIEEVIYHYYLDQYYPSDDEVDEVRGLLGVYNSSRNDGFKFPGKEEHICRQVLFIDGRVKYGSTPIICATEEDDANCDYAARLMYQYLSSVSGSPPTGSYTDLYDPIKDFGLASYGADVIIGNASEKLDTAETDRGEMYEALTYIEDNIDDLEEHIEVIEGSMFGWTEDLTCDSTHWCMCPDMDLNESALEDLETKVDELLVRMEPFANYVSVSGDIATNTAERVAFSEGERSALTFAQIFEPLEAEGDAVIAMGDEATTHITNVTLSSKLDTLKSLHSTIPSNLDSRDFSSMEADIDQYSTLLEEVEELSVSLLGVYNETLNEKNDVETLVLVLEARELDPFSLNELNSVKNKSFDLDVRFRDGMSISECRELRDEYVVLGDETVALLQAQNDSPVYQAFLLFRGFARKVNGGIESFVSTSEIAEPSEIPENSNLAFGGFSLLVLLAFGAILSIICLSIFVVKRLHLSRMKYVLLAFFVGSMSLLLLFSGLLFVYLEKTSTDASVEEYLIDFGSRQTAAIVVDGRDAFNTDTMVTCANALASSFSDSGKDVVIYELGSDSCDRRDFGESSYPMTVASCLEEAEGMDSTFMMKYSPTTMEPHFSIIYFNKAEISGNIAYYQSCPMTALFN